MNFDRRTKSRASGGIRWLTLVALAIVVVALVFDLNFIWGLLFLFWAGPSLFTGVTFLVEPIHRSENPWLFWTIVTLWLGLSLTLIVWDIVLLLT